jgi:hypothetical protein
VPAFRPRIGVVGLSLVFAFSKAHGQGLQQNVWLSAGVGANTAGAIGLNVNLNYSYGRGLLTIRTAEAEHLFGDGVEDQSVMAGLRTVGHAVVFTGALGAARARHFHNCACGTPTSDAPTAALALQTGVHANAGIAGGGLTVSGVVGPRAVHYALLTLDLQLGWLEQRPRR